MSCGVLLSFCLHGCFLAQDYEKLSPFTDVVAEGGRIIVEFSGKEYELLEIDGLETDAIIRFSRETYPRNWEKRFAEDLVEVLTRMGSRPGKTASLLLRDPESGTTQRVERAPMTEENRLAVWEARYRREGGDGLTLSAVTDPTKEDMLAALDVFRTALETRWSYLQLSRMNLPARVEAIRAKLEGEMSREEFALDLQKIIGAGIDGHAGVSGVVKPGKNLPFLIEPVKEGYVAFRPDRKAFVLEGMPFIRKLDGLSIDQWVEIASAFIPDGSPQNVRRHGLRWMRAIAFLRSQAGRPASESVEIELSTEDGSATKRLTLPLASRSPSYGIWPRGGSRELPDRIGYVRIPAMDERAPGEVRTSMRRFRGTRGLVVDVRDNGGGSRDALRVLHSYLHPPDALPRVVNAAVYRLHPSHAEDHLEARFMYRETWAGWKAPQRKAIAAFKEKFKPVWQPPEEGFSEWHYLVLDRLDEADIYHYDKPVVVLMNAKCFSATDIFLAGLKGLPQITLLGEPSGGGSARSRSVTLAPTGLTVRLGSMISYQADGNLFDGVGVIPDRLVFPKPGYFVGGRDTQLEEALKLIKARE